MGCIFARPIHDVTIVKSIDGKQYTVMKDGTVWGTYSSFQGFKVF
jgi:hypothetical protein